MSHFAQVIDGIVIQVIVAEQDFIDTLSNPNQWIQTSYNTYGGINHREDGTPLRKNYAGIGYLYDEIRDAFILPTPYPSWILNDITCLWESPIPEPEQIEGQFWKWDESILNWVEIIIE